MKWRLIKQVLNFSGTLSRKNSYKNQLTSGLSSFSSFVVRFFFVVASLFFFGAPCLSFLRRSSLDVRRLTSVFSCRLWRSSCRVITESQGSFQPQTNPYDLKFQCQFPLFALLQTLQITLYVSFSAHSRGVSKLRTKLRICITSPFVFYSRNS